MSYNDVDSHDLSSFSGFQPEKCAQSMPQVAPNLNVLHELHVAGSLRDEV